MWSTIVTRAVLAAVVVSWFSQSVVADSATSPKYPKTRKVEVVDTYHGVEVPDPYRWLEDDHAEDTKEWVKQQNKVTFGYLEQIPERSLLGARMTKIWDYEKYRPPVKRGGRYFFQKNDGLQNQYVLYWSESLTGPAKVLINPNRLAEDGTVSLASWAPSEDGKLLAYGLQTSGSDWMEWRIRNVDSGEDLDDHLKWVKFSGASWTKDGKGFFYSRYDEPKSVEGKLTALNYYHKLFYHKVGTPQSQDKLIYERPDQKEWNFYGSVTDDGRYLIITASKGTERMNMVFYKDLSKDDSEVVPLIPFMDAQYSFVDNLDTRFLFRTDWGMPRGGVIAVDIEQPARDHWSEVIPQVTATLRSVSTVGGKLIAQYLNDAHGRVAVFAMERGDPGDRIRGRLEGLVELPGLGTVYGFGGRRDDPETFYSYQSFTEPETIFRYDASSGQSSVHRRPVVDMRPDYFETKQVFYESKDGTRIPMFLTYKKGIAMNGQNPTYLYAYGGFNIAITPTFSIPTLVWLEIGGVLAVPNIRGGGEYGKEWHEGGMKLKKQNCFDDFIAAAEWLIDKKYTSPSKLAIAGGSNGGLLVGASMIQRPDLFGAALPAVGVLDMLRFKEFTIGWAWVSDYGSPENEDEFKAMFAYSPYHNLKPGTAYPATLITTGDHDDRVVPAHSFKFAARLQEMHSGPNPVLIRIETSAGHGAGKPTAKQIEEAADRFAFLVKTLDMKVRGF